jgi:Fur family ferric uptake transcriptional regulator
MKRRNTPARQAILSMFEGPGRALSQDVIEERMKGEVDRVTIYRLLNRFCEDGLAHRMMSDEGKYYFALCRGCGAEHHAHNHFHFRCLSCDQVECLQEEIEVKLPRGYTFGHANGWISGRCKACK